MTRGRFLAMLLATSWALRLALIWQGGQRFFPDEGRFTRSFDFIMDLPRLGFVQASIALIGHPDHPIFGVVALPAAAAQALAVQLLGLRDGFEDPVGLQLAASLLSLWSVGGIAAAYALGRRLGLDAQATITGCVLLGLSNSMLYFSRHLVPYDAALCLVLLSACVGATSRVSLRRSMICGCLAGLALATYSGYWAGALSAPLVHIALRSRVPFELSRRVFGLVVGFLAPILLLLWINVTTVGPGFVDGTIAFAGSAVQGDFREGWSLPWEYLWHAEHALLPVWAFGILLVIRARRSIGQSVLILVLTALVIYVLLSAGALVGFAVVYGRSSRQLIPFVCLASGLVLFEMWRVASAKRWIAAAVALVLIANLAVSFVQELQIVFPRTFLARVRPVSAANMSTLVGRSDASAVTTDAYVLLNVALPYPIVGRRDPPAGRVVARVPHPLEYVPYQYEGYSPQERAILRSTDISMRLIDTTSSE